MHAAADRPEFAPPPQPGLVRGFVLAVLAHLVLVFALMHGLRWQRESENAVAEAELWSAVPQQAAPKVVQPPPAPPAPPTPPVVRAPPQPEPPVQREADIALEREKQKRQVEKQRQAELQEKRELEQRRLEAQKKREEDLAKKKQQEQQKLLAEAKRKEEDRKRKAQEEVREAKLREKIREESLKRSMAMAGTGSPDSTGSAARSSGPSASWGAKVQARVRPNIVFTDTVTGNPKAEVEVRTSPDGTIVGKRLVRSSGSKAWDDAVLRALDRTESLPRDVDGRVPSPVIIDFRPGN